MEAGITYSLLSICEGASGLRFAWTNLINQLDLTAFLFLESKEAVCVIQVALAGAEAPAPLIPPVFVPIGNKYVRWSVKLSQPTRT